MPGFWCSGVGSISVSMVSGDMQGCLASTPPGAAFLNSPAGPALWACDLRSHTGVHTQKGLTFGLTLCCRHLEIPDCFCTRGPLFHFSMSSTNYVACPASQTVHLRITQCMQINQIPIVSDPLGLKPLNQHFNKHPINSFTKFAKPENNWDRESSYQILRQICSLKDENTILGFYFRWGWGKDTSIIKNVLCKLYQVVLSYRQDKYLEICLNSHILCSLQHYLFIYVYFYPFPIKSGQCNPPFVN